MIRKTHRTITVPLLIVCLFVAVSQTVSFRQVPAEPTGSKPAENLRYPVVFALQSPIVGPDGSVVELPLRVAVIEEDAKELEVNGFQYHFDMLALHN